MLKGPSPLDELDAGGACGVVPVQAAGGLSIEQAIACPIARSPLVVFGAPLVIDGAAFRPADRELFPVLQRICREIKEKAAGSRDPASSRRLPWKTDATS